MGAHQCPEESYRACSTPAYARTGVPAHLISVLPVRSGRSKRTAKSSPSQFKNSGSTYESCLEKTCFRGFATMARLL